MTRSSAIVAVGGTEFIEPAAKVLAQSYTDNPLINYVISSSSIPHVLPRYFSKYLTAAILNDGIIAEAGGWKSCGVLMPPGRTVEGSIGTMWKAGLLGLMWLIGLKGCSRMVREIAPLFNRAENQLPVEKQYKGIYYLYHTATLPSDRHQGYCKEIIKYFQELVVSEGGNNCIWLEATTDNAMSIYKRMGFDVLDEVVIGAAKCDSDGNELKGGEGFRIWIMVWWPAREFWEERERALRESGVREIL